ncbi:uncharacterized protein GLRG_04094 [Colletotrichum graminicola M1.001]|uniref:Uncharacterized protein n=1 Tax=Colletotrichum graminicola (strain M1.001 / M2 / FGSC 10212) TaxID=645133 RepID=E3QDL2_COLGM|nr:uncharacterized protein GLRG_04094 [Colletotrichum graminicola M1.001]EFQ28950.1 hypothetical protein GLRG_04094 [Colletotrichum graminicola M1.001]
MMRDPNAYSDVESDDTNDGEVDDNKGEEESPSGKRVAKRRKTTIRTFKENFTRTPKTFNPENRVERQIPCVPCLSAALHGNSDGRCFKGNGNRCLRCFGGRSKEKCVPIAPTLRVFARQHIEIMSRRHRASEIGRLRSAIRLVRDYTEDIEHEVISAHIATTPAEPEVQQALQLSTLQGSTVVANIAPVEGSAPAVVVKEVIDPIFVKKEAASNLVAVVDNYNERKAKFLDAIEPLVDGPLVGAIGRYLDKHMK